MVGAGTRNSCLPELLICAYMSSINNDKRWKNLDYPIRTRVNKETYRRLENLLAGSICQSMCELTQKLHTYECNHECTDGRAHQHPKGTQGHRNQCRNSAIFFLVAFHCFRVSFDLKAFSTSLSNFLIWNSTNSNNDGTSFGLCDLIFPLLSIGTFLYEFFSIDGLMNSYLVFRTVKLTSKTLLIRLSSALIFLVFCDLMTF